MWIIENEKGTLMGLFGLHMYLPKLNFLVWQKLSSMKVGMILLFDFNSSKWDPFLQWYTSITLHYNLGGEGKCYALSRLGEKIRVKKMEKKKIKIKENRKKVYFLFYHLVEKKSEKKEINNNT